MTELADLRQMIYGLNPKLEFALKTTTQREMAQIWRQWSEGQWLFRTLTQIHRCLKTLIHRFDYLVYIWCMGFYKISVWNIRIFLQNTLVFRSTISSFPVLSFTIYGRIFPVTRINFFFWILFIFYGGWTREVTQKRPQPKNSSRNHFRKSLRIRKKILKNSPSTKCVEN